MMSGLVSLSVSSYRIAPVEQNGEMDNETWIESFSILISDRSGGTGAVRAVVRWRCFFQYPHIGSLRWNGRQGLSQEGLQPLSVSSYRIAPVELRLPVARLDSSIIFQYPHIGSLRWNSTSRLACTPMMTLSVSSYRIAPVELEDKRQLLEELKAFSILISDRSGGTASAPGEAPAIDTLSVSSYRIAPVERRRDRRGRVVAIHFQYPHIGSLRWNIQQYRHAARRILLSVSSYRIAPVEPNNSGLLALFPTFFQYPHIGSLRWNPLQSRPRLVGHQTFSILISDRSGGTDPDAHEHGARVHLSVSSYRIAPVERTGRVAATGPSRAFSILISDRSGGTAA